MQIDIDGLGRIFILALTRLQNSENGGSKTRDYVSFQGDHRLGSRI